jgi:hypothetical protein
VAELARSVRYRARRRIARQNTKPKNLHPTSTRHNVANMDSIDEAIAAIESLDEGENFTYTAMADQYDVSRTTLSRRHRQIQGSLEDMSINQQKLNPQQELELVQYIVGLTKRGLAPTRVMTQRFASQVAKEEVGEGWVTRFLYWNQDALTP